MEYRGKHYTIVQGITPRSWKWKIYLDDKRVKSGEAKTREAARVRAIWVINQALAPRESEAEHHALTRED